MINRGAEMEVFVRVVELGSFSAAARALHITPSAVSKLVTRIEDQIGDGASFEEVAKANKLQIVETPPVTAAGAAPGTDFQLSVEAKVLLKGGFELSTDDDPQVETITAGQRYAILAVPRIVDPTVPPLAQVQDGV